MDSADTNHARLQRFLQQKTVQPLPGAKLDGAERCVKAGLIPFTLNNAGMRFYVMKPVSAHAELGEPEFQLCKGTRMQRAASGWEDIRNSLLVKAQMETLAETALREGMEELGLKLENITTLFEAGSYDFTSASTGKKKQAWLFAAGIADERDFLADSDIASTTAGRCWMTSEQFAICGRVDHRIIVQDIETKLCIRRELSNQIL